MKQASKKTNAAKSRGPNRAKPQKQKVARAAKKPSPKANGANLRPILSTGAGERMTGEQEARLRQLSQDGYESDAFSVRLTQKQAAIRIAILEAKLRLQDGPPHTL
jgi:hypothetical protein